MSAISFALQATSMLMGAERTQQYFRRGSSRGSGGWGLGVGGCKHLSAFCALTDVLFVFISQLCKLVTDPPPQPLLTANTKGIQCKLLYAQSCFQCDMCCKDSH